jgi:hypothetical protein
MLGKSASVGEVARALGLTRQTVYRIKDNPAAAEAALATCTRRAAHPIGRTVTRQREFAVPLVAWIMSAKITPKER